MAGMSLKPGRTPDDFLAHLTEVMYSVALKHGLSFPFLEIELDFLKEIQKVIQEDMVISAVCGTFRECAIADQYSPWSKEAKRIVGDGDLSSELGL